jgi:hypothetical protein
MFMIIILHKFRHFRISVICLLSSESSPLLIHFLIHFIFTKRAGSLFPIFGKSFAQTGCLERNKTDNVKEISLLLTLCFTLATVIY